MISVLRIAAMLVKLVRYWWEDDNYTHGFFVPFVIGYVVWENRHSLARLEWVGNPWLGACVVCGSILLYWAGILGAELFVTRFALVVTLCGLLLYFGGFTHLRHQLFCLALFSLTIPIPAVIFNQIALPLQLFASDIATRLIALWGIPALREGNVIELMQMKLQVVEACSGIRSLVSLAALSLTIAQMAQAKAGIRFIMLAASVPVAVIVNALRVAATGLTAHYYGAGTAEGVMHGVSGWVMFLLSAAPVGTLVCIATVFACRPGTTSETDRGARQRIKVAPFRSLTPSLMNSRPQFYLMVVLLVLATALTYSLTGARANESTPARASFSQFPEQFGVWRRTETFAFDAASLEVLRPDDYIHATYLDSRGGPLSLLLAYYASQRSGKTFHSPKNCLPGAGWMPIRSERTLVQAANGSQVEANNYVLKKGDQTVLVLYWYQARGRAVASEYWGKYYTIRDAIFRNRTDGALVRLIVHVSEAGGETEALKTGRDFIAAISPLLPEFIPN